MFVQSLRRSNNKIIIRGRVTLPIFCFSCFNKIDSLNLFAPKFINGLTFRCTIETNNSNFISTLNLHDTSHGQLNNNKSHEAPVHRTMTTILWSKTVQI